MKGGKGSKMMKGLKDPNLLREIVKVADDAIPVAEKAGNAALNLINNAVPVVKNVGNADAAFDLVDRGVKTADNIIDVAVDIPFKFARKIQDLGNRNVKNGVTQAVNCIRDVEIKSSLINNLRNNVASNTHRISNLEGIVSNHGQRISNLEGIVSNHGQRI